MNRTRSGRWGRRALASLLACSAVLVAALAIAGTASAYEEHQFCTGKNLSGEEGCGSGEWYVHSAYANGTSAPICLIGPEQVGGGCMHATNEGIWLGASEPYGYWGRALIVHTINQPPTKVYGTFWTGAPAPKGESPPPPPPSSWHGPGTSVGGTITSSPDVASQGPGKLDLFARGTDGALWHRTWSGSAWSNWSSLGGYLKPGSGPGAVSKEWPTVDVFARTSTNGLENWFNNGSTWAGPGTTVTGEITSDPDLAAATVGQLDLFARGTSGSLMHKHWNGSSWSNWENMGGQLKEGSGPTAVSKSSGTLDVFGRTPENTIVNWYFDGTSWHGPGYTVGGNITSDPDVAVPAPGQLDLFVRGTDGALWHKWWSGTEWSNWASLGGYIKEGTGPTAVSKETGTEDVFAEGAEGSVVNWYFGP
jgi:hypothetical protein